MTTPSMIRGARSAGAVVTTLLIGLVACGGDSASGPTPQPPPPPPAPAVAVVEVQPGTAELLVSDTVRLRATVRDAQGNVLIGRTVTWSSGQSTIATVTSEGLVTAVSPGTAAITATVDGRSGSATVTSVSPLPAPICRDCLEVVPGSLLLNAVGAQLQLAAYMVDAAGVRTPVNATFTSSAPGVVTVTPGGLASAVALGSAQITAQGGGRTSVPVLVLVAAPAPGALLVTDVQVKGPLTPVDPDAPYGPGYRYKVRLRDMQPTIGQMLIGTGSLPLMGRVMSVTAAGAGLVDAELEVRPIAEALPDLTLHEKWTLSDAAVPGGAPRAGTASVLATAADDDPLEEGEFRLGPFTCKLSAGVGISFPLNLVVDALELNQQTEAELVYRNGEFQRLVVTGGVSPRLVLTPKLTAAIDGGLECRKTLFRPRIPIGGPLSLVLSPVVPIGVGFKFEGKVQLVNVGYKLALQGRLGFRAGIDCSTDPCSRIWEPDAGLTGSFEPVLQGPSDLRLEMAASGFAFAELKLTNPIADQIGELLGEDFEIKFLEAVAGLKQKLELASPVTQADDPAYASGADLSAFYEVGSEGSLKIGDLLSIKLFEQKDEGATPLATTPRGDVVFAPETVRASAPGQPGDTLFLRATIFPVTYLGAQSVEGVEFFWKTADGLVSVCGLIEPDHPGQVEFECDLTFTEAHVGPQTFYAFVTAKIFGVPFATPFEIAPEAKVVVQVIKEPPLVITTTSLPAATVGVPYSTQLQATGGGSGAMHWQVVAGLLPGGLTLNPSTGQISGTPTEACVCEFAVELTRGAQTAARDLAITVNAASMAGQFAGTWKYLTGHAAGLVRAASGRVRIWDGGEYGNHLLAFSTVDGNGACGLMVTGGTIEVVAKDNNCLFNESLSLWYVATSWSVTRDELRITFAVPRAQLPSTAELRLTRVP